MTDCILKNKNIPTRFVVPWLIVFCFFMVGWSFCHAGPSSSSLNAGLPAVFDPAPNYPLCTDDGDRMQLSDGAVRGEVSVYAGESAKLPELLPGMQPNQGENTTSLWTQQGTVGWSAKTRKPILISFDLGELHRVGGVKVSTAAGIAGVYWPAAIAILVSKDGKNWAYAGELISRSSSKNGLPPAMGYTEYVFADDTLNVDALYVGIAVYLGGTPFFFTDEIEILEGDASGPADTPPVIGSMDAVSDYMVDNALGHAVLRRLILDYSMIQNAIQTSSLDAEKKAELEAQLRKLEAACNEMPQNLPKKLRTVIPINDIEAQLLSIYGSFLQKSGYPPLLVSQIHRNAYLGWLQTPKNEQQNVTLSYRQMRDESRGDLLLLTNATPETQKVKLDIDVPHEAARVFYCPWTDTPQMEPVATALLPAERTKDGWEVVIPAGLTMKVWVSVDASRLPVGKKDYPCRVIGAKQVDVVLKTDISPVEMDAPQLHLGMWDYSTQDGHYAVTPSNRDAAMQLMRSHGVDSPWGAFRVVPTTKPEDFDAEDNLVRELDYTAFDEWIALWPGARRYMLFVNVSKDIAGIPFHSSRFSKRVAQWARALVDHAEAKGIRSGQLHLLLVDEPRDNEQDALLLAWAKPIKKEVGDALKVWSNPIWKNPGATAHPEAFTLPDALCPNWGVMDGASGAKRNMQWDFYQKLQQDGKPMELYMCSALAPHTDPNRYFRLMSWAGWKLRIQGIAFWAFGDQGGLKDAWYAYQGSRGIWYTPVFLGENSATDTLQWQAVREGILDYAYLLQLEKRLPEIQSETLKKKAEHLLSDASINEVFHGWTANGDTAWEKAAYSDAPDDYRKKILNVLEEISGEAMH